jgi:hypothetical protein
MTGTRFVLLLVITVTLAACATIPPGPSVMVLPGSEKPFEVFQAEDFACKQFAAQQIGATPNDSATQNMVTSAAIGTALGAGLGAAIGAASGHAGAGAAIGAASGLLGGTLAGSNYGYAYGWEAQRRYDIAYQQCMYAKGNQIPGVRAAPQSSQRSIPPPPPGTTYPAPSSGAMPPPPPPGTAYPLPPSGTMPPPPPR